MINLICLAILIIWIVLMIKNKKNYLLLPYLLGIFILPLYNYLDKKFFLNIFGCGCVPISQTNMLNIPYNANDLRLTVYLVLSVILTIVSIIFSKTLEDDKILYVISVLIVNLIITFVTWKMFMWA